MINSVVLNEGLVWLLGPSPGLLLPRESRTGLGRFPVRIGGGRSWLQVGCRFPWSDDSQSRTLQSRRLAMSCRTLNATSGTWRRRIAGRSRTPRLLPVPRGLVALADHSEDELWAS